jgi:hypothetical protein
MLSRKVADGLMLIAEGMRELVEYAEKNGMVADAPAPEKAKPDAAPRKKEAPEPPAAGIPEDPDALRGLCAKLVMELHKKDLGGLKKIIGEHGKPSALGNDYAALSKLYSALAGALGLPF